MPGSFKDIMKKTPVYPLYCKFLERDSQVPSGADPSHVWAFNAGEVFLGNPKWLFLYVNQYRKDIYAYWICKSEKTAAFIRSLGYRAFTFSDHRGYAWQRRTGVFVVEQVKEVIPPKLRSAVLLNLYHGVGCKSVEKKVNYGLLQERIAKKYIQNNEYYQSHMLFLVTSPLMEKHFTEQCGLKEFNLIRAGYPRCVYQPYFEKVSTFDHDIRAKKGLSSDTRIAAYVPTYRDNPDFDFWGNAIPDFPRLIERLKQQNMLLILKLHPRMEKNAQYLSLKARYQDCPYLLFWDNTLDFYEILDQIDLGIVDYSSIFYDMLEAGVKQFIRYFFDYEAPDSMRDLVFDVKEMTCGALCSTFEQFLAALERDREEDPSEIKRIHDLFWQYSGRDSMDVIIDRAIAFRPAVDLSLPTLYSFDVFDTLIARKVLAPEGIFYYVKQKMQTAEHDFPQHLLENYPKIRAYCEENVRVYYRKTTRVRKDDRREISFREIFDHMAEFYALSEEQIALLMEWELEAEYENCIPRREQINWVESLVTAGETVLLISDMYLPRDFVQKLLHKVNPVLSWLPLFLSSEYGVQKTTRKLYLQAYSSLDNYNFKEWIHYGDNPFADGKCAEKLGITPRLHTVPSFNEYETHLIRTIGTYDAYLAAADLARFRETHPDTKAYFTYAYISLFFVPYVDWAVHHAKKQGTKCLYFISRDGHHLKEIADAIIREEHLDLKTKYIYGSRKVWRNPSYIEDLDEEFFYGFGNFADLDSYDQLRKALGLTEAQIREFFPGSDFADATGVITPAMRKTIINFIQSSKDYREYVLTQAAKDREIVEAYLRQEIDPSESFAFVEYWGRGYTQDCFTRLMHHTFSKEMDVPYYYARSIYPTQGHNVRYNFSPNPAPLVFAEAIFANIPYKTIAAYKMEEDRIVPEIISIECDMQLHEAMEEYLPLVARNYARLSAVDRAAMGADLYHFGLNYYDAHQDDPIYLECLAPLIDSISTYGDKEEFAPILTEAMLQRFKDGERLVLLTRSLPMSAARSDADLAKRFLKTAEKMGQVT